VSRHLLRATPDGDLFLQRAATWDGPPELDGAEFVHVAARTSTTYRLSGERTDIVEPEGDRGERRDSRTTEAPPRLPVPGFGQWQELLALAGEPPAEIVEADRQPFPVRTSSVPPWRPARPLRPTDLETLFTTDARVEFDGREFRLSVHDAGQLQLPTGRLVAADPSSLEFDADPFEVTVAPGTYRVSLGLATPVEDRGHSRVTAARLELGDRPAVRWEMALRDGQDPIDLGPGEFFGFGVDAGLGCYVDAGSVERVKDVWETLDGLGEPPCRSIESGTMIVWSSGWGDGAYPTWIGYDDSGAVTCFVADMLLFAGDEEESDDD
jgi:hypothetical protein